MFEVMHLIQLKKTKYKVDQVVSFTYLNTFYKVPGQQ